MGLFGAMFKKDKTSSPVPAKLMSDETAQQLKDYQDRANAAIATNPGALPDMGADPEVIQARLAAEMADAQRIQTVSKHGVEAPAVIRAIRATGETNLGGARTLELDVSIRPPASVAYQTQIRQSFSPTQLEGLAEGRSITVKYDPDEPGTALVIDW